MTLPRRGGGSVVVVGHPAVLDRRVRVDHRPGRAGIAVERQADAAGVHELDPALRPAPERQVRVAEDQRLLLHPASSSSSSSYGSGMNERTSDTGDPWQKRRPSSTISVLSAASSAITSSPSSSRQ